MERVTPSQAALAAASKQAPRGAPKKYLHYPSKTLAKLANRAAKTITRCGGVCALDTPEKCQWLQRRIPVEKVWGIAGRLAARLEAFGIKTAYDLANADPKTLRQRLSVNVERTILELNGKACYDLESQPPAKKQIYCTRSFGQKLTKLEPILQATTLYASRAAEKLRQQNHLASTVHVFLNSSPFQSGYVSKSTVGQLPYPTDDSREISRLVKRCIRELYEPGPRYMKAGVGLIELRPREGLNHDLFHPGQSPKANALMATLDAINDRFGRGTLFLGAEGVDQKWRMRQAHKSPAYTTRWSEIPTVRTG